MASTTDPPVHEKDNKQSLGRHAMRENPEGKLRSSTSQGHPTDCCDVVGTLFPSGDPSKSRRRRRRRKKQENREDGSSSDRKGRSSCAGSSSENTAERTEHGVKDVLSEWESLSLSLCSGSSSETNTGDSTITVEAQAFTTLSGSFDFSVPDDGSLADDSRVEESIVTVQLRKKSIKRRIKSIKTPRGIALGTITEEDSILSSDDEMSLRAREAHHGDTTDPLAGTPFRDTTEEHLNRRVTGLSQGVASLGSTAAETSEDADIPAGPTEESSDSTLLQRRGLRRSRSEEAIAELEECIRRFAPHDDSPEQFVSEDLVETFSDWVSAPQSDSDVETIQTCDQQPDSPFNAGATELTSNGEYLSDDMNLSDVSISEKSYQISETNSCDRERLWCADGSDLEDRQEQILSIGMYTAYQTTDGRIEDVHHLVEMEFDTNIVCGLQVWDKESVKIGLAECLRGRNRVYTLIRDDGTTGCCHRGVARAATLPTVKALFLAVAVLVFFYCALDFSKMTTDSTPMMPRSTQAAIYSEHPELLAISPSPRLQGEADVSPSKDLSADVNALGMTRPLVLQKRCPTQFDKSCFGSNGDAGATKPLPIGVDAWNRPCN